MPLTTEEYYKETEEKVKAAATYNEVVTAYKDLKKKAANANGAFQQDKNKVKTQIDQLQKATGKKRFERDLKNQTDRLFDILKLQSDTGNASGGTKYETTKFLREKYVEAVNRLQDQIETIVVEEYKKLLGCDQQNTFLAQELYIPLKSIDLFGNLYDSPDSTAGALHYETQPVDVQKYPFSMNRELFDLIITAQPYSTTNGQVYLGYSGRELFDIEYIASIESYKVTLKDRIGENNLISDFLTDYFETIKVLDLRLLWVSALNSLINIDFIASQKTSEQVKQESTFMKILKRILGLCFDDRQEIDVAGTSKVPELDGVDEEFFEMNDIDLRDIDQTINNVRYGVVQFQDCTNVDLPVNTQGIYNNLLNIKDNMNSGDLDDVVNNIFDSVANSPDWPKLDTIKLSLNENFIKTLPMAIVRAILTPKVLLPFMIMLKSIQQTVVDTINGIVDFSKKFKTFIINVTSRIVATFVKILYELIKKDIKKLFGFIKKDIITNKIYRKYRIIFRLIEIGMLVNMVVTDFRKCKNVIKSILNAILLALQGRRINIPAPLLVLAEFREGFDPVRAFLNIVEEYQKIGIPTGPMPDGSPNVGMLAELARVIGTETERDDNAVTKQIITAADIAQITQVGFVTKSGIVL